MNNFSRFLQKIFGKMFKSRIRQKNFNAIIDLFFFVLAFILMKLGANETLMNCILVFFIILTFSSHLLYHWLLLDSQSTSFIFAKKTALLHHYDPIGQDGRYHDPEKHSITAIYLTYPQNRLKVPLKDTAGFMFTTYHRFQKSNKVEFYEYNSYDDGIRLYEFTFDTRSDHDFIKEKMLPLDKLPKNTVFMKLDRVQE